jgi:hypothetical protein
MGLFISDVFLMGWRFCAADVINMVDCLLNAFHLVLSDASVTFITSVSRIVKAGAQRRVKNRVL